MKRIPSRNLEGSGILGGGRTMVRNSRRRALKNETNVGCRKLDHNNTKLNRTQKGGWRSLPCLKQRFPRQISMNFAPLQSRHPALAGLGEHAEQCFRDNRFDESVRYVHRFAEEALRKALREALKRCGLETDDMTLGAMMRTAPALELLDGRTLERLRRIDELGRSAEEAQAPRRLRPREERREIEAALPRAHPGRCRRMPQVRPRRCRPAHGADGSCVRLPGLLPARRAPSEKGDPQSRARLQCRTAVGDRTHGGAPSCAGASGAAARLRFLPNASAMRSSRACSLPTCSV